MAGRVGEIKNGELWIRCPYCGDSRYNLWKAHMSVNLERGLFHCHRCNVGGILPPKLKAQLLSFPETTNIERQLLDDLGEVIPGPGSTRKSRLARYHYRNEEGVLFDVFEMKDPKTSKRTGFHMRGPEKLSLTYGTGLGWEGKKKLISSPAFPLYLVEGPYDVTLPREICCFGLVTSRRILQKLKGQYVVLVPDGDVWQREDLLRSLLKLLKNPPRECTIIGVEYLPDGKDPDEVSSSERTLLHPGEILSHVSRKTERKLFYE